MLNRIHYSDRLIYLSLVLLLLAFNPSSALAQGTSFTYQGKLSDGGTPATGNYDLQFKLFDTATIGIGSQQGATVTVSTVAVTAGIFSVQLDFGACASCFNGSPRFLEIAVKPTSGGTFTTLSPRQPITSTPYAIRSLGSTTADGLSVTCVNCITSSQIQSVNGSAVTGTIPVASIPAGSANYIQNTMSLQAAADFNISGNGTAAGTLTGNLLNATLQYNLGGSRVLSNAGTNNLFAGIGAGQANTTGNFNSFFGSNAGRDNSSGFNNTYFGDSAGYSNTTANSNAFFGTSAGVLNTASSNSFFGSNAGRTNTTGFNNSFFGNQAGSGNTTGNANAFFGHRAGFSNTSSFNSFFGAFAGQANTTGIANAFFGQAAGFSNTTGGSNAFFGSSAGGANTTGTFNAFFGTSAGQANTASSNSFFGAFAGQANTTGGNNAFFGYQAGVFNTTGGNNAFFGTSAGQATTEGAFNAFFGERAGFSSTTGNFNAFFGKSAGEMNTTGVDNVFFGTNAGFSNITGTNNTVIGDSANVGFDNLNHATAIGADAIITASNRVQIGRDGIDTISIGALTGATSVPVCINGTVLSSCSSSRRYKDSVQPFISGLNLLQRLRPVTFNWKGRVEPDLGLIAEEVAALEPLLITRNQKGEIEGVKYAQLNIVLINAIKEQQAQIEEQRQQAKQQVEQMKLQQREIAALKKLVCLDHPEDEMCKP